MYLGDDEQSSPKYLLPIVGFITPICMNNTWGQNDVYL